MCNFGKPWRNNSAAPSAVCLSIFWNVSHLWTYKAWIVGLDVISVHNISARASCVYVVARLKSSDMLKIWLHTQKHEKC